MEFYKYHGCGNDFILCEYDAEKDYNILSKKVCNRYIGIGADTLIVVDKESYRIWFYNADGTKAPMCGNGIRCAAAFLKKQLKIQEKTIGIITDSGIRKVYFEGDDLYKINMGIPNYNKNSFDLEHDKDELFNEEYEYNNVKYNLNGLFLTTHHLVIPVDNVNISEEVGNYFCKHKMFKKGINVDFVKVIDRNTIALKVYERGCGFTKACGSGATSSVAVLNRKGIVDDKVKVLFEYGELLITKEKDEYYMTGPAVLIADNINLY